MKRQGAWIIALVLVALSGCATENDLSAQDLLGPWEETGTDSHDGTLLFDEDGSVSATNLVYDQSDSSWKPVVLSAASGSWKIRADGHRVRFSIEEGMEPYRGVENLTLYYELVDGVEELRYAFGDPDSFEHVSYRRPFAG